MMSTRWTTATRFWVLTAGTLLAAVTLYRLRNIVPIVGLALILAYIINPLVDRIQQRSPLGRTGATVLVYLGLLAILLTVPAISAPTILEEARAIDRDAIQQVITNIIARIQAYSQDSELALLGFRFDLAPAYDQLIQNLQNLSRWVASQSINFLLYFASGFASTLLGLFLILVMSFYVVKDSHVISSYLESLVPDPYTDEVVALADEINQVWSNFFRGQLVLVLVVGVVTWSGLFILGVPNALLLGVLAGILELIPNLGPTLAAIPAVFIAYFQGSTHLPLTPGWFALAVILLYVVIQQVENAVLVPRIIGGSVHLHPVVVLIGVLAGASMAGILGIFLAAPVMASIRVLGSYAYTKLLEPPVTPSPTEQIGSQAVLEEETQARASETAEEAEAGSGRPEQPATAHVTGDGGPQPSAEPQTAQDPT